MIINHNMASLNTYRQLSANNTNTSKSLEKLSSGLRINRAGDDAAGLAISEKMRGQIRGLDQATRNAQDATSMLNTAEGNLNEVHSILQRMKELATQASNDTNVGVDRGEIQKEINQLSSEINRVGNTTEFNTQKLLNGGGEKVNYNPFTITAGGQDGVASAFAAVATSVQEKKGVATLTCGTLTAGQTLIVDGQSFSVVSGTADASLGQVAAGTASIAAASLAAAINANTALNAHYGNAVVAAGKITLTERAGQATGVALSASGTNLTHAQTTTSIKEVAGKYTFNLDKAFELVGGTVTIGGVKLTAVNGTAGADQFLVGSDREEQAKSIAAAINSDTNGALGQRFEATVKGTTVTLTEKAGKATGVALAAPTFSTNTAVKGDYTVDLNSLTAAGGRFIIDGHDIAVVNDATDARLATGEAMMAGATLTQQASNLAQAVNRNSALAIKYTASGSGEKLELKQQGGHETLTAPKVTTSTVAQDGFKATFQIGANSDQSMTIEIGDMRSNAIHITGNDAKNLTVTAKNGKVANFVATANVSNGTTNDSVEYSLDVSDYKKATAAISVISDAIETVSAERSKIGAYTNRLEHTINNLGTSSENLTAAESRIRDVDMAKEMMNYQKNNILSQAATAMLAQANQQPQGVLQLLR